MDDVAIAIDIPLTKSSKKLKPILIIYALPNGNTTGQTMGKKMVEGDDWHFDIQHIRAQTKFIRSKMNDRFVAVAYLENIQKSWPAWKSAHPDDYKERVKRLMDYLNQSFPFDKTEVYLNGHSGGGRFIFSFLDQVDEIPSYIKRISFLDSDYGYDSTYFGKIRNWLLQNKDAYLNVFAYNDSVALYNGKPVVSPTGGTWYRSGLMMRDLSKDFTFKQTRNDSIISYSALNGRVQFFFKTNPDQKIYHTQQVELNGFIHSILCGTKLESKGYRYYDRRAYAELID
jgi:hypothetical protein